MAEKEISIDRATQRLNSVKDYLNKYNQELTWLTGNTHSTPELGGAIEGDRTVGQVLFPELTKDQVKEFDRTAVGLLAFNWVMDGDYDSFTECQPENQKLSRESFQRLREFTRKIVPDDDARNAMNVYLVVNDLTKVNSVVEELEKRTGEKQIDHDVLLLDVLKNHKDLSPSFAALPSKYQELVINGLSAKFNMGHLSQAEGPAAIMTGLKDVDAESLNFYLVHVLYDTAGVVGHIKQNGSLVMNEPTFRNMEMAIEAIDYLRSGHTETESYDHMLEARSKDWDLDINKNPADKAVARVACMLRLSGAGDKQKVDIIKSSLESIGEEHRNLLIHELNKSGLDGDNAILIYYGPAILANAETAFKKQNDTNSFAHSIDIGLRTFARIFAPARELISDRKGNGVFTVMSNEVATLAGKDPNALLTANLQVVQEGPDARVKIQ